MDMMMDKNSLKHQDYIEIKGFPNLEDRRTCKEFLSVPWSIYKDDAAWVPPLHIERRMHLSASNPYFKHAKCRFWIAYRQGIPVGRISAQIDSLHIDRYQDSTGFWGMLEAENRKDTVEALLHKAEQWLRAHGIKQALGPFNLSINQECGLLVDGFNTPPSMMMGHARPWYKTHIEACGYTKAKDLLAYTIDRDQGQPLAIRRLLEKNSRGMRTRGIDKSRLEQEMDTIFGIFNNAWSNNWGFIPFERDEYQEIGNTMRYIADSRLIRIAEIDDEPAGFIVVLPNLNEAIKDLNGRLLPFGWLKIIWRMKVKRPETGRVLLMGVIKKYRDTLAGAAITYGLFSDIQQAVRELGMKRLELSWILEDNMIMRRIIEALGGKVYKTYRIYGRKIGDT